MPSTFSIYLAKAALPVTSLGFAALALHLWNRSAPRRDSASDPMATDFVILDRKAIEDLGVTTAETEIQLEGGALEIPASALLSHEGRRFVFVRDFELPYSFVRVPVETAGVGGSAAVITRGLFPGDEVVVTGVEALDSEKAASLSGEALKRYLDAPFHRTEHPTCPQKFWQCLRGLFPQLLEARTYNSTK